VNPDRPIRRCAIYTRKSSEEGLDQAFNSLDAQREACAAYIASQRSEGWKPITTRYDDGGWSGGNMERPGLQRLLDDINGGRVDVVVVYKIDRLTRSLADFAKIVEIFDRHGASFVAVTQQFNTTTSMGRLTLNILLSFAQFEREVTGERIRDKIAASKKKGMWMGGSIPLGYDVKDRKLVVNPAEAETVRLIFRRYLELGSVRLLVHDLRERGIRSKARSGERSGGTLIVRGALYTLLNNPIYIGETRHKTVTYPGQHDPILDRDIWDQAQRLLKSNGANHPHRHARSQSPLLGKLFDENDVPLTPSHARKGNRRYRYYVSRDLMTGTADQAPEGWRVPANQMEKVVSYATIAFLCDRSRMAEALSQSEVGTENVAAILSAAGAHARCHTSVEIMSILQRVGLRRDGLHLTLNLSQLVKEKISAPFSITTFVPMRLQRRGIGMRLVIDGTPSKKDVDQVLVNRIARGYHWFQLLVTGEARSTEEIAGREQVSERYVRRLLPLALLAPDIIESIMAGTQPPDLTAESIVDHIQPPLEWAAQRHSLGFA